MIGNCCITATIMEKSYFFVRMKSQTRKIRSIDVVMAALFRPVHGANSIFIVRVPFKIIFGSCFVVFIYKFKTDNILQQLLLLIRRL